VTIPSLFGGGSGGGGGAAASGASGGYSPAGGYSQPARARRRSDSARVGERGGGGSRIPGSGFSPHAMLASIKGTDWVGYAATVHEFDEQGFATGERTRAGSPACTAWPAPRPSWRDDAGAARINGQDMGTWAALRKARRRGHRFTMGGPLGGDRRRGGIRHRRRRENRRREIPARRRTTTLRRLTASTFRPTAAPSSSRGTCEVAVRRSISVAVRSPACGNS